MRRFADEQLAPIAAEIDAKNEIPQMKEVWKKLGDMGLLGITAPGGRGEGGRLLIFFFGQSSTPVNHFNYFTINLSLRHFAHLRLHQVKMLDLKIDTPINFQL